ncbi:MAG TPA: hypothetical protein VMW69_07365, partial [Spirochaetia bacterium]|nr:hypothetical protein [Spirochaetia bacterium]
MAQADKSLSLLGPLRGLLVVAICGFLANCATTPPAPSSGSSTASTAQTSPTIEASLKNLGIASPSSLLQAENALGESTAGYSNYGLELSFVTYKMIQILYPLYLKPEYVIYPP